jgi:hypothetical protein
MFITSKRLTRRTPLNFLCLLLLLTAAAPAALADELAIWNFNDSNLNVDDGSGTLSSNFNPANLLFAAGTTNNVRLGQPAGQALSLQAGTGTVNNGRHITFNVSTLGFSNIVVSFATQGTSTGFNSNQFQYSLDGITFVNFGAPYTPPSAFGSIPLVFSLTTVAGLDNNPDATFRILFNGASSATGTNRIDNFVVEGTEATASVPEPMSAILLLSGLSGLYAVRKRKRAAK